MKKLEKIEEILTECEKDLKELKKIRKKLRKIDTNRKELNKYYNNQYIKDYDEHANSSNNFRILDQDSIWNVLTEQYNEKIKILKSITKNL